MRTPTYVHMFTAAVAQSVAVGRVMVVVSVCHHLLQRMSMHVKHM